MALLFGAECGSDPFSGDFVSWIFLRIELEEIGIDCCFDGGRVGWFSGIAFVHLVKSESHFGFESSGGDGGLVVESVEGLEGDLVVGVAACNPVVPLEGPPNFAVFCFEPGEEVAIGGAEPDSVVGYVGDEDIDFFALTVKGEKTINVFPWAEFFWEVV